MPNTRRPNLLVLIRHAESERNKAKKGTTYFADDAARQMIRGIPDHKIPLTSLGIEQARITGEYVRERFGVPDYFYNSGYLRTEATMNGILAAYPRDIRARVKIRMNPFIGERHPGYTYDMTKEEAEKHFPWLNEHWKTFGGFFGEPPGGESLRAVSERVHLFLNILFRDRVGQNVFVTTHGGTLRCFRFLLEHWDFDRAVAWPEGQSPKNCGITVYEYDESRGKLVLREYNIVAPGLPRSA